MRKASASILGERDQDQRNGSAGHSWLHDVREEDEWDFARIEGAIHIPMNEIPSKLAMLPKGSKGLVLCHHGMRSAHVIVYLQQQAGFKHVFNLAGGIDAWSRRINPDIPRY